MPVALSPRNFSVHVTNPDKNPVEVAPRVVHVDVSHGGVPGPDASVAVKTCATAISGHAAVIVNSSGQLEYASNSLPSHSYRYLGITEGAAVSGATAKVRSFGELTEPSWSWTPDLPVYLGVGGGLTQTPPSAPAFSLVVGFPATPTTLLIQRRDPIVLV